MIIASSRGSCAFDRGDRRATSATGGATTTYSYDTASALPMLLADGTRNYVWGANGLAYTVTRASGAIEVSHADGLGSVRALTDATGTLIQTYRTDAFGIPTATQGSSAQPFRYTGEQVDPTGLIYLRARVYDPRAGRFLQRDTLVQGGRGSQGLNRYTYVQNNPVNYTDPSGRCALATPVCVAVAAGGGAALSAEAVAFGTAVTGTAVALVSGGAYLYDHRGEIAEGIAGFFDNVGDEVDQVLQIAVKNWPAELPRGGSRPYVPPKANHGRPEKNRQGEYVDARGNRWKRDPSKPWFEWDVQHPTGGHTNVGPDGEPTHGDDNFPYEPEGG